MTPITSLKLSQLEVDLGRVCRLICEPIHSDTTATNMEIFSCRVLGDRWTTKGFNVSKAWQINKLPFSMLKNFTSNNVYGLPIVTRRELVKFEYCLRDVKLVK